MSSKALKALISGKMVYGTSTKGKKFIQVFGTNGSLQGGPASSKGANGKWAPKVWGTWRVSKGRLCNSYTKPKKRSGGCDKFYVTSSGKYVYQTKSGKWGRFDRIVNGR